MFYKYGRLHRLLSYRAGAQGWPWTRALAVTNTSPNGVYSPHDVLDLQTVASRTDRNLSSLVRQFVQQIGEWWQPSNGITEEGELTVEEMTQQLKDELEKSGTVVELEKESMADLEKAARPNIWKFLQPTPLEEIQKSRFMASLSNACYFLANITSQSLLRRYGLHLVTTSLKCKQPARSAKMANEALMTSDGMAVAEADIPDCEEEEKLISQEMSNIVTAAMDTHPKSPSTMQKTSLATARSDGWTMPIKMGTMATSLYSQSLAQLARQITIAATVSHSAVSVTLTRVMNLLHAALRPSMARSSPSSKSTPAMHLAENPVVRDGESKERRAISPKVMSKCPTEWFVCDDAKKEHRIFCIQGTDSFESWQTNLKFDPVPFEDASLGVRVHRGIYEAALGLYGLFVPLVRDHIESGSNKKISLCGHSLGGAIAAVLLMMMVHRGVLSPENVGQVYTFGGAACFCDASDCSSCSLKAFCAEHEFVCKEDKRQDFASKTILERLGLAQNTVVNVIMHKDIVPRAFACDYALVADLLRRWSHSFRKHHCLTITGRALLYSFIGEIRVLQPDADCSYVQGEGYHPMFPAEAGLFRIMDPDDNSTKLKETLVKESLEKGESVGSEVSDRRAAFLALMDNPHPLDMLSEPRAYGVSGAISRYHNPGNYSIGLRSIIIKNREKLQI